MLKLFARLKGSNYQPLNRIVINKEQLIKNLVNLRRINQKINVAPVLKSNAYGHGLLQVAPIIDNQKPQLICVDSLPEANSIRKLGIKSDILIMGAVSVTGLQKKLDYQMAIVSPQSLKNLINFQNKAKVHLFIDTGMNREGIRLDELPETIKVIKSSSLQLTGIMTHLAVAAEKNHPLTKLQIENFKKAKEMIWDAGFDPQYIHIGGSDALSWISEDLVNMARVGRVLYGVQATHLKGLEPVLKLETSIVQIKVIKKGEQVGYSATYTAQKDTVIGLLPIGYNDGVDRRLSNKGVVKIKEKECPIIGLISMNMTVVDISAVVSEIEIGEKVTIFDSAVTAKNSIENSAKKAETNPSDLLVGLHPGTRREVS